MIYPYGKYCHEGIKEKGEAECLSIQLNWSSGKGEFYFARKNGGVAEPGEWIELLKRDGNKIYLSRGYFGYEDSIDDYKYFFINNFEIIAQKNYIIITNYYGKGNSKRYNLM